MEKGIQQETGFLHWKQNQKIQKMKGFNTR